MVSLEVIPPSGGLWECINSLCSHNFHHIRKLWLISDSIHWNELKERHSQDQCWSLDCITQILKYQWILPKSRYHLGPFWRTCSHKFFTFQQNIDEICHQINSLSCYWAPGLWEDVFVIKLWFVCRKLVKMAENHTFFTKQAYVATIFTTYQIYDSSPMIFIDLIPLEA